MYHSTTIAAGLLLLLSTAAADSSHLLYNRQDPVRQCTVAAIRPVPQGIICNTAGRLIKPAVISTTKTTNASACRDQCFFNAACLSFSYTSANQQCKGYSKSLAAQQFQKAKTNTVYWARGCFSCSCPDSTYSLKCGNTCVDPTSTDNCKTCGNHCASGQFCDPQGSGCFCPSYANTLCSGSCTDLGSDSSNCGSCGTQCPNGQECDDGTCQDIPSDPCFTLTASDQALIQDSTTACNVNGQSVLYFPPRQGANTLGTAVLSKFGGTPQVFCLKRNSGYLYRQNTTDTGIARYDTSLQVVTEVPLDDNRIIYCFYNDTNGHFACMARGADGYYADAIFYSCCSTVRMLIPNDGEAPAPDCYPPPDKQEPLKPVSFTLTANRVN